MNRGAALPARQLMPASSLAALITFKDGLRASSKSLSGPGSWPGNRGGLVRDGLGGQGRQRGAGCERYVRLGKVRRQRRRGV